MEVGDVEANILSSDGAVVVVAVAVPRPVPAPGGSSEAASVCSADLHLANQEAGNLHYSTCLGSVETISQLFSLKLMKVERKKSNKSKLKNMLLFSVLMIGS